MMRKANKRPVQLHEPGQAVDNYLATLLSEVPEYCAEQQTGQADVIDIRPAMESVLPTPSAVPEPAVQVVGQQEVPVSQSPAVEAAEYPAWAREPFQCLFFTIKGVRFAIPLFALNSIAEWSGDAVVLPGQPDWYRGVILHRQQRVVVVDLARLIMPERGWEQAEHDSSQEKRHLLIVGEGRWGLSCDRLQRPETLRMDAVKWCAPGGNRPWVAGTVIDKLCVLLDMDALLEMIGHETCM